MALVFLDMIKLAVTAGTRGHAGTTGAQYVVFGAYDLLYYSLSSTQDDGLEWLASCHEERHNLDWNYERHPVFLYCPEVSYVRLKDVLDERSYASRPLVLTMARIAKHPLVGSDLGLDEALASLQTAVERNLGTHSDIPVVTCWNLGNADFVILSRPECLSSLRDLYLALWPQRLRLIGDAATSRCETKFCSLSSHCAFPLGDAAGPCIDEDSLRAWLDSDRSLSFIDFVETIPDASASLDGFGEVRFLFGDRDYQLFNDIGSQEHGRTDAVQSVVRELLDPGAKSSIQTSSLIPSLPITSPESHDVMQAIETYRPSLEQIDQTRRHVMQVIARLRNGILDMGDALQLTKDGYVTQLEHCMNTLDALYKHAERLYAAAYQDDVFSVVRGLYDALAYILDDCTDHVLGLTRDGNDAQVKYALASIYGEVMLFVSELQHVYTVLAVSPHSHMETYYGSMRSLNASSKLWTTYNGVAIVLSELFPTHNQGPRQDCHALLVPYREKNSQSRRIVPKIYSDSILVCVQLNYQTMFNTGSTVFSIAHELGHYVFNETREFRRAAMLRTCVANAILACFGDALAYPLYALTAALRSDRAGGLDGYRACVARTAKPNPSMIDLRKSLCLGIRSDLAVVSYGNLYRSVCDTLRKRYLKVINEAIVTCANEFDEQYQSCVLLGEDVSKAIAGYVRERQEVYLRQIASGMAEAHVEFLDDIDDCEKSHSVVFDRQQIVKLKEYWCYVLEKGTLANREGLLVQPDPSQDAKRFLTVFRETHADIFACKVTGFSIDDYLDWVSSFADSSPELVANSIDLHRIAVVCESALGDAGCARLSAWLSDDSDCPFSKDVRAGALSRVRSLRSGLYYGYLREYGRAVASSVDLRLREIGGNPNEHTLLDNIRLLTCGKGIPRLMWEYWLKVMLWRDGN